MSRFYEKHLDGEKQYWFETDGLDMQLNEDNLFGNLHEEMGEDFIIRKTPDHIYDRIGVLDPRDEMQWQWWRVDLGDEAFEQIEYVCRRIGSFLVRQTALDVLKDQFDATPAHQLQDNELDQLLGDSDGNQQ